MKTNYYTVLGFSHEDNKYTHVSLDAIKKSYRKLAMQFHPDLNPGKQTEQKFCQLQNAYAVLSDPVARTRFDQEIENSFGEYFTGEDHLFIDGHDQNQLDTGSEYNPNAVSYFTSLALPTSKGINLTQLIANANYSSKELLEIAAVNPSFAEALLNNRSLLLQLNEAEQYEVVLLLYQAYQQQPDKLSVLFDNESYKYLGDRLDRTEHAENFSLACLRHKAIAESLIQQHPECLRSFSKETWLRLVLAIPNIFEVAFRFKTEKQRLCLVDVLTLSNSNPKAKQLFLSQMSEGFANEYAAYQCLVQAGLEFNVNVADAINFFVLKTLELIPYIIQDIKKLQSANNPSVLIGLNTACIKMMTLIDCLDDIMPTSKLSAYQFTLVIDAVAGTLSLCDNVLKIDLPNEIVNILTSLLDDKRLLESDFSALIENFSETRIADIDKRKVIVDKLLNLKYCSTDSVTEENTFLISLLKKGDSSAIELFSNNHSIVLSFIQQIKAIDSFDRALLLNILENRIFNEKEIKNIPNQVRELISAQAEFKTYFKNNISYEKYQQLFTVTGFYPALLELKTKDINLDIELVLNALQLMNKLASGKDIINKLKFKLRLEKILRVGSIEQLRRLDGHLNTKHIANIVFNAIYKKGIILDGRYSRIDWTWLNKLIVACPSFCEKFITYHYINKLKRTSLVKAVFENLAKDSAYEEPNITISNIQDLYNKLVNAEQYSDVDVSKDYTQEFLAKSKKIINATPNVLSFAGQLRVYLNIDENPFVLKRVQAYNQLNEFIDKTLPSAVIDSEELIDGLVDLIIKMGIDAGTLNMLQQRLERYPGLLGMLAKHLLDKNLSITNMDIIKQLDQFITNCNNQNIRLELIFLCEAKAYLNRHKDHISGADLNLIVERFGDQILPAVETLDLTTLLKREQLLNGLLRQNKDKASFRNAAPVNQQAEFKMLLQKVIYQSGASNLSNCSVQMATLYNKLLLLSAEETDEAALALINTYTNDNNLLLWLSRAANNSKELQTFVLDVIQQKTLSDSELSIILKQPKAIQTIAHYITEHHDIALLKKLSASHASGLLIETLINNIADDHLRKLNKIVYDYSLKEAHNGLRNILPSLLFSSTPGMGLIKFFEEQPYAESPAIIKECVSQAIPASCFAVDESSLYKLFSIIYPQQSWSSSTNFSDIILQQQLNLGDFNDHYRQRLDLLHQNQGIADLFGESKLSHESFIKLDESCLHCLNDKTVASKIGQILPASSYQILSAMYSRLSDHCWTNTQKTLVAALIVSGELDYQHALQLTALQLSILETGKGNLQELYRVSQDPYLHKIQEAILQPINKKISNLEKENPGFLNTPGNNKLAVFRAAQTTLKAAVINIVSAHSNSYKCNEIDAGCNIKFRDSLKTGLIEQLSHLSNNGELDKMRKPIGKFFKGLLGVLVGIPTCLLLLASKSFRQNYHARFFAPDSKNIVARLEHDAKNMHLSFSRG